MRPWLKEQTHTNRKDSGSVADGPRMSPTMQYRTAADTRRFPSDLGKSTAIKAAVDEFTYLDPPQFHGYFVADLQENKKFGSRQ